MCGNWSNPEIYIIENENGKRLKLGSSCIDHLTNREVSKWFNNYKQKRTNIIKNGKKIDGLSSLLKTCRKCGLSCEIPFEEVEKLRALLGRMCKGLNLSWEEDRIVEGYLDGRKILCG
jgi:hypothetical protein